MPEPLVPRPVAIRGRTILRIAIATVALLVGPHALAQELVVFAASSLTESFEQIADVFEARHDGVDVLLAFGGSSTLALQILQGAPADVFASANPQQMQRVVGEGLSARDPHTFTTNRLVILAAEGTALSDPGDLARDGLRLVLATPVVPVGAYAREAIASLAAEYGADFPDRVLANVVSEEPNVRQVAARVELGEVDAAVVYATDAIVVQGVEVLEIPAPHNVIATYPIVALEGSSHPELARAFIDFVRSAEGQAVLAAHGFQPPE